MGAGLGEGSCDWPLSGEPLFHMLGKKLNMDPHQADCGAREMSDFEVEDGKLRA